MPACPKCGSTAEVPNWRRSLGPNAGGQTEQTYCPLCAYGITPQTLKAHGYEPAPKGETGEGTR